MNETTNPEFMTDNQGRLVPIDKVKPEHIEEDALVKTLMDQAEELNSDLALFKRRAFEEVDAFRELIAEKYGVTKGGKKGNISLTSYDGRFMVQVAVQERTTFGPELEAAKALIDECVTEWSKDSNDNIKVLVEHAFQTNKQGKIDTQRVLSLRQLNIEDDKWKKAMDAIADALRTVGSSSYIRLYKKHDTTGQMMPVSLDVAKL